MRPFASFARRARLALVVLSPCAMLAGGIAHAEPRGNVPPGWVWQGTYHDGRWDGQWSPGPDQGPQPGAYPAPAGAPAWGANPEPPVYQPQGYEPQGREGTWHNEHHERDEWRGRDAWQRRDECERNRHRRNCDVVVEEQPQYMPGPPQPQPAPPAYGAMPYPAVPYAPMMYMMMPVVTAPQAPYVETHTTVTKYIEERPQHVVHVTRVIHCKPRYKEKRVYTGS